MRCLVCLCEFPKKDMWDEICCNECQDCGCSGYHKRGDCDESAYKNWFWYQVHDYEQKHGGSWSDAEKVASTTVEKMRADIRAAIDDTTEAATELVQLKEAPQPISETSHHFEVIYKEEKPMTKATITNPDYSPKLKKNYQWAHVCIIQKNKWIPNCQVQRIGSDRFLIISCSETREIPADLVEIRWLQKRDEKYGEPQ